ncbi:MAG: phosphodiester glycosidase family protein [Christensenellales bacterium]|jgi:exopolysaccharide biosynthesis protein
MKKTSTLILALALLISLALPFLVPSGALLDEANYQLLEERWQEEEDSGALSWLIPSAAAQPALEPLPMDFSPGRSLDPAGFTAEGYEDESILVQLQTREEDGVRLRIATISISDPSQLRTATAGKPTSSKVALISSMAQKHNAVLALNANYMNHDPVKNSFEYRMGVRIRKDPNRIKDLLIIDENADFHLFVKSNKKEIAAFEKAGHTIVNAFTFGPALVKDGVLLTIDKNYGYNPHGREPRLAIGQLAPLQYIVVLVEGLTGRDGVTQQEMAQILFDLGARQAFNLDGGNSATLVFNGGYYQNKTKSNERAQTDMIYFASLAGE